MEQQLFDRLKKTELDILKKFIEICENYNLSYFAVGGTLIGAVRHGGFIPWDDDIDISMPRKDYDKLIALAENNTKVKELLGGKYFLQTNNTDADFPMNYAKMRDISTTFIEKSLKNVDIAHGVYIDIFPLDNYPDSVVSAKLLNFKNMIYYTKISSVFYFENKTPDTLKIKLLKIISNIICRSVESAVGKRNRLIRKYNKKDTARVTNHSGAYGAREVTRADIFREYKLMEFEDINVHVPLKYDEYLTQIYGDYMCEPPLEKQIPHHFIEAIDLDMPYDEYKKQHKMEGQA